MAREATAIAAQERERVVSFWGFVGMKQHLVLAKAVSFGDSG